MLLCFAATAAARPRRTDGAVIRMERTLVLVPGTEESTTIDLGAVHPPRGAKLCRLEGKELGQLGIHVTLEKGGGQRLPTASGRKEALILGGSLH